MKSDCLSELIQLFKAVRTSTLHNEIGLQGIALHCSPVSLCKVLCYRKLIIYCYIVPLFYHYLYPVCTVNTITDQGFCRNVLKGGVFS